jgi:hypothetical protein
MESKTTNQIIKDYEKQDSFIREHEFTIDWIQREEIMIRILDCFNNDLTKVDINKLKQLMSEVCKSRKVIK